MVEVEFVVEGSGCADIYRTLQSGRTSEVSTAEHHLTCGEDICRGKGLLLTREMFSTDCNSFQDNFTAVNKINAFIMGFIAKLAHVVSINARSW